MSDSQTMPDEIMEGLMGDFLDESSCLLTQLNEKLLALDGWAKQEAATATAPPIDMLNEMFRAAHSLKGLSGMLRLTDINVLTHKVENVFDAARNGVLPVTTDCVDVIFPAIDCISAMIDALRSPADDAIDSRDVVEKIEALLTRNNALAAVGNQKDVERELAALQAEAVPPPLPSPQPPPPSPLPPVDPLAGIVDDADVPPRYVSIFLDETTLTLDELTEHLLAPETPSVEFLLGRCHRIKGSSASIGLHRPAKLAHAMEDYLQEARRTMCNLPIGGSDILLECIDAFRCYIFAMKEGSGESDKLGEAMLALALMKNAIERQDNPPSADAPSRDREAQFALAAAAAPPGATGFLGYARLSKSQPLASCKADLILVKVESLGQVFHRWTSDNASDASARGLEMVFGVLTALSPQEVEIQLQVEGVECLELKPIPAAPAITAAAAAPESATASAAPAEAKTASAEAKAKPTETLRVDIERLDQLMNLAGQLVINRARFGQISEGLKSLSSFRSLQHSLSSAQHHAARLTQGLTGELQNGEVAVETLAEMVLKMRCDLDSLQRDLAQLDKIRFAVSSLTDAVHQLDRVSDGIQSTVMDTRMVPVGPLFTRFRRAVRDLTRDNRKDIRLEIRGENTELDKRMIDELGDPLIHLVRNSVDHGIESAEVRRAAGKPEQGVVSLNAFHRGNRIVIEVSDDGKGLDVNRIREKALSKGLITEAEAESMTPQQIQALIWRPGFSTAEKITEVSGRGMGMDIVWSKIEALNGVVEVNSELGKGCTFSIKLPLTMAILPSLLAVIGREVFAIPVESVTEIVRVSGEDLASVQGQSVIRVRGRVISLIELDEIFEGARNATFDSKLAQRESLTMVIMGADSREIAILVDNLIGEQDVVIQSLTDNFQNIEGIAGASILGDGRISLILDVPALLDKSSRLTRALPPPAADGEGWMESATSLTRTKDSINELAQLSHV